MRTELFTDFAGFAKEFHDHLEILWKLPDEQRRELIPAVIAMARSKTTGAKEKVQEESVSNIEGNSANLLRALQVLFFLYKKWSPVHDSSEAALADFIALGLFPREGVEEEVETFIKDFFVAVEGENTRRMTQHYSSALLPSYHGCSTVVDIRPVFRAPFGSQQENPLDKYNPELLCMQPVILVKLQRDSGDPRTVEFQMEPEDVAYLTKTLEATLHDIEAVKTRYPELGLK